MPWFYYVVRAMIGILLILLTRYQLRGRDNIPSQGAVLVVANHLSLADPPLIVFSLGQKVAFMAKEELFRSRFASYFLHSLGAFPVYRKQTDRQAIRQAKQVLAEGVALVMFPEGKRSRAAQLHSGAPILPVGIIGTEKIKGIAWILHRPQITVNIGHSFYPPSVDGKLTKDELARLTSYIMERIAELLPSEYQGNYARKEVAKYEN